MKDRKTIDRYIKFFGRRLSERLRPGIIYECSVYPVEGEGAVLEFSFSSGEDNKVTYKPVEPKISSVLERVPQKLISGNISGVQFGGTNISMEKNRLIIIKGENTPSEWDGVSAKKDIAKIFHSRPDNSDE